jgi:thiamine biosynthesis lipoprotein
MSVMTEDQILDLDEGRAEFHALGTTIEVLTSDPEDLGEVLEHVWNCLDEIDLTFSRFRSDSELNRLEQRGSKPQRASDLFLELVDLAYKATESTGGWFDPTVRDALEASGYDRSIERLEEIGPGGERAYRPAGEWYLINYDRRRGLIELRDGVRLDFGGIGKGFAVDYTLRTLPPVNGGVLINAGGDLAVSGPAPAEGWICDVGVTLDSEVDETIVLQRGAIATSGLGRRQWQRNGQQLHHLIDPHTGKPGTSPWRIVTVGASSCVAAEVAAKVAWLRGADGPDWLNEIGLSGRFARIDGRVVTVGNWPRRHSEGTNR